MITMTISQSQIRQVFTPKLLHHGHLLMWAHKHTWRLYEPGGSAGGGDVELGPNDGVGAEERLGEVLDHDTWAGGDNVAFAEGIEELPRERVDVLGVEPGEDGPGHDLDVPEAKAGESEEDQGFNSEGFGEKDVGEVYERDRGEKDESAKEAPGLQRDEEVVREGRPRKEEGAIEVRGDGLVGPVDGGAIGDWPETMLEIMVSGSGHSVGFRFHYHFTGMDQLKYSITELYKMRGKEELLREKGREK